ISGADREGMEKDVTNSCRIASSNPAVVEVNPAKGLLIGKSPGRAEIRISLGQTHNTAQVTVGSLPTDMTVRFSPDIISILTIKGCNSSGCHGSPAGQSGFRLSLFGYDVDADHQMIVKSHDGRRVNLEHPEESLLLQKPSFTIPHGGGQVLSIGSDEYRTILNWLKQGAPLDSSGVRLTKLEIYPAERILVGTGSQQHLVIIGRLSDGTTRDMTREVRYAIQDQGVARIADEGVMTAAGPGLTTVMARAMGKVATAQIGVIEAVASPAYLRVKSNNFVDDFVFAKLRQMNVPSSPVTTDREFVRRVYLDAIGQLPTIGEVRAFLDDSRLDKRSRLIEVLLERPEYASHWTVKFEDWFRNHPVYMFGRSLGTFKDWIRNWVAEDRPYDQVVRELLTSTGDTMRNPAANFWFPATDFMLNQFSVNKATPTVTRLFLGVRLECTECHNHPLENFTQDDFYGVSAFLGQLQVKYGTNNYRRTWFLEEGREVEHPVTKKRVAPKFLGGEEPLIKPSIDRRAALADWVVSPANPYFARATVNRIWQQYFQVGIVEPFDDFRSTNMPTNRQLLDHLAKFFVDSGYRLKPLHRIILNSKTYQLSSRVPDESSEPKEIEHVLFARYFPRKLSAEVLIDAVGQVTSVAHKFKRHPQGTSAKDLYIENSPDDFLMTFGFPRRDIISDRNRMPTLSQALYMINADVLREQIESEDNVLGRLLARGVEDLAIVSEIYLRAYAREPGETERKTVSHFLASERAGGRERRKILEDVLWAVINSKEFQLNS
ncbi:MAG: DUF1553 domain-containing protein, partial [Acidobacteria bacterium]|nr:DUF1553 domain-containing protein [Acidobacteriota bacterium]